MSDSPRLDRIEQIVISLEADMKIMANSVSSMATSMEKFVEMQTDHKLLKQEMKHNCDTVHNAIRKHDTKLVDLEHDVETCKEQYKEDILTRFKEIEVIVFFARKPKILLVTLLGMYVLTFQEFRHALKPFLPFF